jgi:hypothetical protein
VGKREVKEYCLGCGKPVEEGVMTCFDCIQSVAPELAEQMKISIKVVFKSSEEPVNK